jgi:hypothetical protein
MDQPLKRQPHIRFGIHQRSRVLTDHAIWRNHSVGSLHPDIPGKQFGNSSVPHSALKV